MPRLVVSERDQGRQARVALTLQRPAFQRVRPFFVRQPRRLGVHVLHRFPRRPLNAAAAVRFPPPTVPDQPALPQMDVAQVPAPAGGQPLGVAEIRKRQPVRLAVPVRRLSAGGLFAASRRGAGCTAASRRWCAPASRYGCAFPREGGASSSPGGGAYPPPFGFGGSP